MKNLTQIKSTFSKMISNIDLLNTANKKKAKENQTIIDDLGKDNLSLKKTTEEANRMKSKIKEIIS